MTRIKTDLCIIGAGSGGLSIAAGAVQMGADVVLLEGHKMGGDCLNYGCVPSKALLSEGKRAKAGQDVGFDAAKDHVADVIATIEPHDSVERFAGLGVKVIQEYGRFLSPTEVQAGDMVIEARRFVIATGSGPLVPPIDGIEDVTVHTNETIFELRDRPDHLLVIGGGPIGMEMAQAHRRLGCRVTVIEGAKALGKDDPDLAAIVLEKLRAEEIEIVEGAQAKRITQDGDQITVHTEQGVFTGSHLLMAVGRKVNVEGLDLEKAGVDWDKGGVKVDDRLRSISNRRVYAVGDVAGGLQFTHVAGYHAGVVIRSALLGLPAKQKTDHIPWTTYTDPELAQVGLTEAQAREVHGDKLEMAEAEFAGNDRAVAEGRTTGKIKVMVVKGRPVGASIAGPMAGEMIAMWAMAIANNLKMSAISNTVLPYPTFSEINKRAAGAYFGPRLFENRMVKRVVRLVQRWLP
ncbi:MAG: FAD-dependent oxidoreductase [Alphaproteobacteria bacterium]|jgi:pyruvate/2-oxoglutarate dehydrogenase complex dihydrolipoamide dehydrogenase (E3) component|nr:FAD-dependent oxidoreductase [Alphaproteobacteria bacterium]